MPDTENDTLNRIVPEELNQSFAAYVFFGWLSTQVPVYFSADLVTNAVTGRS